MQKETLKNILTYAAGFALVCFITAFVTFQILDSGRLIEVPGLAGMSITDARAVAKKKDFALKVESEEYDQLVPEGHVIWQDVPPGALVAEQKEIIITVSKGPMTLRMPSVLGKEIQDAKSVLLQKGLKVSRVINVRSDGMPKGYVIAQKPEPDGNTSEAVTLLASAGPFEKAFYCPSFEGMAIEEASALAAELGIIIEADGTGRTVVTQSPRPGATIRPGQKVRLRIE